MFSSKTGLKLINNFPYRTVQRALTENSTIWYKLLVLKIVIRTQFYKQLSNIHDVYTADVIAVKNICDIVS